ncbi:MAG: type VI secretion system baseplate subunit TssE [Candidatus Bipolaricaulia bacterium]
MARDRDEPRARLSVLDRLIDPNPGSDREEPLRRTVPADTLKRLVRRDLEWLLSTRRTPQRDIPPDLGPTVTEYGIPDFAPVSPADEQALSRIAYEVRTAIEAFEPRLQDVTVQVEPTIEPGRVQATVEALLVAGEVREPVAFPFKVRTGG